jgi:GT2 family glycosyltransferase
MSIDRPLATVVIVTWNGRALLEQTLPAVLAQTYRPFEVLVVDNGSTDGTVPWLRRHFPTVRLLRLPVNRGFAGGANHGLAAARGSLVATLNNDCWPEPTWLAALVETLLATPGAAMCASKMLFAHQPDRLNSTGLDLDVLGLAWDRDGGRRDGEEATAPPFGPCAGAALYRREAVRQVGGFDSRFFCYLEDVDLAWRLRRAGWTCAYAPQARVYHLHAATLGDDSPWKRYLLGRNKLWLLAQNYPRGPLLRRLPLILLYDLLALASYALWPAPGRPWPARWAALAGRLAGWWGLPAVWRGREPLPADREALRALAPAAAPWVVARRFAHLQHLPRERRWPWRPAPSR